jgi:hypothetical protein
MDQQKIQKYISLYNEMPIERLIDLRQDKEGLQPEALAALEAVWPNRSIEYSDHSQSLDTKDKKPLRELIAEISGMGVGISFYTFLIKPPVGLKTGSALLDGLLVILLGSNGFCVSKKFIGKVKNTNISSTTKVKTIRFLPALYLIVYFVIVIISGFIWDFFN